MQARRIMVMAWMAAGALCLASAVGCQSTGSQQTASPDDTGSEWREGPSGNDATARAESADTKAAGLQEVYFGLDEATLDDPARDVLRKNADAIQSNPDWGTIVVEGHCDERGSEEYNLGLGARRAESVARYLRDLGVPSERLSTVSFGEDRPAVSGHSEDAWRYNRRSELRASPRQASN